MRKSLLVASVSGLAALVIHTGLGWSPARAQAGIALTGRVNSEQEGPMEGVVVTARKEGSTISVSVVSDDTGRYNFPAAKLESGDYALKICCRCRLPRAQLALFRAPAARAVRGAVYNPWVPVQMLVLLHSGAVQSG